MLWSDGKRRPLTSLRNSSHRAVMNTIRVPCRLYMAGGTIRLKTKTRWR